MVGKNPRIVSCYDVLIITLSGRGSGHWDLGQVEVGNKALVGMA